MHGRVADRCALGAAEWRKDIRFGGSGESAIVPVHRAVRTVRIRRGVVLVRRHGVVVLLHRLLMVLLLRLLLLLLLNMLVLLLLLLSVGRGVAATIR